MWRRMRIARVLDLRTLVVVEQQQRPGELVTISDRR
jgi:hypothetical protein